MTSMENFIHCWMCKITHIPLKRHPRKFLNAWISSNRPVGRPCITTRTCFLGPLKYYNSQDTLDFKCPNGNWINGYPK